MTDDTFQVRVEGVGFAAAHFATFDGICEPLHGHSYEVAAEVDGTLTDDSWVLNFIELKSILRSLAKELDHRFILQRESRVLEIESLDEGWKVRTPGDRVYVMPASDVVALPIDNTTAERLAQWFSGRVHAAIFERGAPNIRNITIEVWEGTGQRAAYRKSGLPLE